MQWTGAACACAHCRGTLALHLQSLSAQVKGGSTTGERGDRFFGHAQELFPTGTVDVTRLRVAFAAGQRRAAAARPSSAAQPAAATPPPAAGALGALC